MIGSDVFYSRPNWRHSKQVRGVSAGSKGVGAMAVLLWESLEKGEKRLATDQVTVPLVIWPPLDYLFSLCFFLDKTR